MGTWGYQVGENDAFVDIYDGYFHYYNNGMSPEAAAKQVLEEFADHFSDSDDTYESYFALSFAQWETKALDPALLQKVTDLIESGHSLRNWTERGGGNDRKRKRSLSDFLQMIRKPRRTKKRRAKPGPRIKTVVLVSLTSPDGLKTLRIQETYREEEFISASGMMMWADGGGSIFYVYRSGMECTAKWLDAQRLEIRFSNIIESELQFGAGNEREAFFDGDRVQLIYLFD